MISFYYSKKEMLIMNDKGKGIFYGVVAVATLIVAIVGATLAYFSIMVNSENNAVGLSSDIVSISYSDGQYLINPAAKLIPATNEVVKKAYERVTVFDKDNDEDTTNKCIDDNGKEVCSVYRFTVSNDGEDRDITASIKVGLNEFTNLRYMVYEVTTVDGNTVKTNVFDEITGEDKSYALPLTTDESSSFVCLKNTKNSCFHETVFSGNTQHLQICTKIKTYFSLTIGQSTEKQPEAFLF